MTIRVVHVVAGLWKDTGGPAEVIPNLCRAQADAGMEVTLCTLDGAIAPQVRDLEYTAVKLQIFDHGGGSVRYSPGLARYLERDEGIDVVHNHGHWLYPNWCAAAFARRRKVGLVTTPHGTLVPGMLARSSLKKQVAWSLFDRRLIARADIIHALSEAERTAMVPKLGRATDRTIVIPNGVNVPGNAAADKTDSDNGTLLFLSRLSPIKGVVQLLSSWKAVGPKFPGWTLKMVGPIDASIRDEVETRASGCQNVMLVGPVYGDDRWDHYRAASGFILPTQGEGLPTVLLEAAAYRLPIITTREANFPELTSAGGCLISQTDEAGLTDTLQKFLALSGSHRAEMGRRGAELIENNYGWARIARRWADTYSQILSQDAK